MVPRSDRELSAIVKFTRFYLRRIRFIDDKRMGNYVKKKKRKFGVQNFVSVFSEDGLASDMLSKRNLKNYQS